jgi:hypothetical protein
MKCFIFLPYSFSRSHAVLQLTIKIDESVEKGVVRQRIGKINLVDLAGAECINKCLAATSAQDTSSINKSLCTLGRVIDALVEKSKYIPYRLVHMLPSCRSVKNLSYFYIQGIKTHPSFSRFAGRRNDNKIYHHNHLKKRTFGINLLHFNTCFTN